MPSYRIYEGNLHFITCTVIDWIDVFTRPRYAEIIVDSLAFCQAAKGLIIHAYVIMPSHLHLIVSHQGKGLSNVLRDFKQFTSRSIVKAIHAEPESRREWLIDHFATAASLNPKVRHAQFWRPGNHSKVCYSFNFTQQKLNYIHQNPVKARLVHEAHQYVWSSAQDYLGKRGPLEVTLLG